MSRRGAVGGFTLLEALTSVTIIAILCSLLLPAAAAVVKSARRTACANQLRGMFMAVDAYGGEWRGFLPEVKQCGAYPNNHVWWDIILPYVPRRVGSCPSLPKNYGWPLGYGMVHNLNGRPGGLCPHAWSGSAPGTRYWCGWTRAAAVARPMECMLIADSNNFHLGGPSNRAGYASWNLLRLDFSRHGAQTLPLLFLDGHVGPTGRDAFLDNAARFYAL